MRLIESLKKKKFILLNIFFTLYIGINLIGGERGLISYFDKKQIYQELKNKEQILTSKLEDLENQIKEITLSDLPAEIDTILKGQQIGRIRVKI